MKGDTQQIESLIKKMKLKLKKIKIDFNEEQLKSKSSKNNSMNQYIFELITQLKQRHPSQH